MQIFNWSKYYYRRWINYVNFDFMQRVVITGIGVWCSIGKNIKEFHKSLIEGSCGLKLIPTTRFDTRSPVYRTNKACVIDENDFNELCETDKTILTEFSIKIISEALMDANIKIETENNIGLVFGTSIGGGFAFMQYMKGKLMENISIEHNSRDLVLASSGTIGGTIAKRFGLRGPVSIVSTACSAGTNSLGLAYDLIRHKRCNVVVSGGVDLFTELTFSGFNSLQALSKNYSRPFDENRDGLMLGDGGGFLVLESLESARKRKSKIYAEIKGYSTLNEAYHPTAPNPTGEGAIRVMKSALEQSNIETDQVEYINAHGTGTKANDIMEFNAISSLFTRSKNDVYISSTKSMIGHTLGAAGSIEAIATLIGMENSFMPPTININNPLSGIEKNIKLVLNKPKFSSFEVAMSNSFAFSGNISSIVFQKIINTHGTY